MKRWLLNGMVLCTVACAQQNVEFQQEEFLEHFNDSTIVLDSRGIEGWTYFTGDGNATMSFIASGKGYATIIVDATKDKRGIWWALIKRSVSGNLNLNLVSQPDYEFRIEARIRVSDAPKRVNLHLNTQRTKDFHTHLMEFDIPDTTHWHTISMTTENFDIQDGDTVYGQLALMDWGFGQYRVDIDYFKVRIVHRDSVESDCALQVPYHPPLLPVETFSFHLPVTENATVDTLYDDCNFSRWFSFADSNAIPVLAVGGSKMILLRWDFSKFSGREVSGGGILELRTHAVFRLADSIKDFGMLRVSEIIGGDASWTNEEVTYRSWSAGVPFHRIVNSQMIIDVDPNPMQNGATYIAISKPVLQRLLSGKTFGILIRELGSLFATFYSNKSLNGRFTPILHFSLTNTGEKQ